jgi:hypothetical protein
MPPIKEQKWPLSALCAFRDSAIESNYRKHIAERREFLVPAFFVNNILVAVGGYVRLKQKGYAAHVSLTKPRVCMQMQQALRHFNPSAFLH